MSQTIEILVSPQGDTTVQTRGFTGAECQQASRFLEKTLGESQGEQLTAEFYRASGSESQQLRNES